MCPKTEQTPEATQEDRVWGMKLEIGEWGKDKQLPTLLAALLRGWTGLILLLWNDRESDVLHFLWDLTHRGSWPQGLGAVAPAGASCLSWLLYLFICLLFLFMQVRYFTY